MVEVAARSESDETVSIRTNLATSWYVCSAAKRTSPGNHDVVQMRTATEADTIGADLCDKASCVHTLPRTYLVAASELNMGVERVNRLTTSSIFSELRVTKKHL